MYKPKRQKRDTVENIYRQCQVSGNCPPDVVNKVENTTLADYLLKIFGSVIYLGGLGIGTGSSAGATGFRPIPDIPVTPRVPTTDIPVTENIPLRPTRPIDFGTRIDPISSAANRPRPVNPQGPAIVPLNEGGLPDPTVISSGAGPGAGISDYEVLTNIDVYEDLPTVDGHPTVLPGQDDVAILQVTPTQPPPTRLAYEYPRVDGSVTIIESSLPAPTDINVFVDPNYTGVHIGEEIELEPINTIQEFEIEENIPRTSTPARILDRAVGRARQLYNRFVEQAPTRNIDFLGQPSRAILFEFENPAFSNDVTLEFERDLQEVAAAPDPTFTDVIQLHRPQYSETSEGLVRYSRLGTRGKVSTRSGAVLRQNVHFFYDLSPITAPAESIEMNVLEDASDAITIVDELSRSTFINPVFENILNEDLLQETFEEDFANSHLALLNETEEEQVLVPTLVTDIVPRTFSIDYPSPHVVIGTYTHPTIPISDTTVPIKPAVFIEAFGSDFYLHPSLLRRRKRKYSDIF